MVNEFFSILKLLIENQGEIFSIRKISQLRKINYKSAYNVMIKLKSEGLVDFQRVGNATNCSFSKNFNSSVFNVEYERRNELIKNSNFRVIYESLNKISFPFIVLLFGSHAKKTATKHSDIDILSIGGDQKEIKNTLNLLPDKIHLTSINYEEFIHMAKRKEFTIVSEAIKSNVIILGIEEYYRLLKNAE